MPGKIQTVNGPIPELSPGLVDGHIHFLISLPAFFRSANYDIAKNTGSSGPPVVGFIKAQVARSERAENVNHGEKEGETSLASLSPGELNSFFIKELRRFHGENGKCVIDCSPFGCGRNGKLLSILSKETGVNIVAVTGFHKDTFYKKESGVWKLKSDDAAEFFISEIKESLFECRTIGPENTGSATKKIKAGVIKLAYNGKLEGKYYELAEAALNASLETGAPLLVHTDHGINIEELAKFLEKGDISPENVLLSHMDKRADFGLHRDLAQRGYFLEYDTFMRQRYLPEKNLWPLIQKMAKEGYGNKVVAATDIADNYMWEQIAYSEGGLAGFFGKIAKRLQAAGIPEEIINAINGGNAARFLHFAE